eukprot:365104-Chlamydomonas_euryale.AAC.3
MVLSAVGPFKEKPRCRNGNVHSCSWPVNCWPATSPGPCPTCCLGWLWLACGLLACNIPWRVPQTLLGLAVAGLWTVGLQHPLERAPHVAWVGCGWPASLGLLVHMPTTPPALLAMCESRTWSSAGQTKRVYTCVKHGYTCVKHGNTCVGVGVEAVGEQTQHRYACVGVGVEAVGEQTQHRPAPEKREAGICMGAASSHTSLRAPLPRHPRSSTASLIRVSTSKDLKQP